MNDTANLLHNFGFPAKLAKTLAEVACANSLTLEDVRAWLDEAKASTSLHNPLGFIRARLQDGDKLPDHQASERRHVHRHRYKTQFDGIYPDHPNHQPVLTKTGACGHVVWKDRICPNCGLCNKCCTCQSPDPDKE